VQPGSGGRGTQLGTFLVVALILIAALSGTYQAWRRGVDQLVWDECEYVSGALKSADNLHVNGLSTWLDEIASRQKFVKPPLLVNILVPLVMLTGRDHIDLVLGIYAGLAVASALCLVAFLVWKHSSGRVAWVSVLAVGAMPAVGYYGRAVYPEILLVSLTLAVVAVLPWPPVRLDWWRAVALGFVLGLGMLGKTIYPALVTGPLVVWFLVARRRDGSTRCGMFLAGAGLVAFGVARVWYATNFERAWDYATGAYGWSAWTPESRFQVLVVWGRGIVNSGVGLLVTCVLVATVLIWLVGRFRQRAEKATISPVAVALLLAAAPLIVVAVSSPNVNQRLIMPALVCVVVAVLIGLAQANRSRTTRYGYLVALVSLAIQFAVVQIGWIALSLAADRVSSIPSTMQTLNPFLDDLARFQDPRSIEEVFDALAETRAEGYRTDCWLICDYREFNQNLLQMHRHLRRFPVSFRWGSYFSWPREHVESVIADLNNTDAVVAWYQPRGAREGGGGFLNRHSEHAREVVRQRASGFEMWRRVAPDDGAFVLELYRNFGMDESLVGVESHAFGAEFGAAIRIEKISVGRGRIAVTCRCVGKMDRDYRLMVHAQDLSVPGSNIASWDQSISPPTSRWRVGQRYALSYRLSKAKPDVSYRLELAFFEEVAAQRRWRRMPRTDMAGLDSVTVTATPVRAESGVAGAQSE